MLAEQSNRWKSSDPESIPYQIRLSCFKKGNLVKESEFSNARQEDYKKRSFWSTDSQGIEIIDEDDRKGILRISRDQVTEVATPLGATSSLIEVISGNYDFSCSMKMEGIKSNRERLGVKIFDAVFVRLKYYDREKIEISPLVEIPYPKTIIDSGLKILSFANEWEIQKLDWTRVLCRAAHYPFCDGDLPVGTRYVQILIGLCGSGILWVHDVRLSYSRWNFTQKERLLPLIQNGWDILDLLLPKPKYALRRNDVPCFSAGGAGPVIHVVSPLKSQTADAVRYLKNCIKNTFESKRSGVISVSSRIPMLGSKPSDRLRIILGMHDSPEIQTWLQTEEMASGIDEVRDKPESYVIRSFPDENVLIISGKDERGVYWGCVTLCKLLNKGSAAFAAADINDWPDFHERPWVLHTWKDTHELERDKAYIENLIDLKLNRAFAPAPFNDVTKKWWEPEKIYYQGLHAIGLELSKKSAVKLGALVHPYMHFKLEEKVSDISAERRSFWTHSNPESRDRLLDTVGRMIDCGADTIMLMSDDLVPHASSNQKEYCLWDQTDIHEYGDLETAQGDMIQRVFSYMRGKNAESILEFCPPYYLNEFIDRSRGWGESYFRRLRSKIPDEVAFIWCGGTVRSLSIDGVEMDRFEKISGSLPVFWDNTLYARTVRTQNGGFTVFYPGKVKMCSLFEAYDIQVPDNFNSRLYEQRIFTNATAYTDLYRLKYCTVADFEWNMAAYDPDESMAKALIMLYGKDAAEALIEFNDAFFKLVDLEMNHKKEECIRSLEYLKNSFVSLIKILPEGSNLPEELGKELVEEESRIFA